MASNPHQLDDVDWRIIRELRRDARMSFRNLAQVIHLSPAATTARVHALEAAGVITGYSASLDPKKLGRGTRALVRISATSATTRSVAAAQEIGKNHPAVREVFMLLGDSDLLFYVEASDIAELDALVTDLGGYGQTTTSMVVDSFLNPD